MHRPRWRPTVICSASAWAVTSPSWSGDGLGFDGAVDWQGAVADTGLANVLLDRLLGGTEHVSLEHGHGNRRPEVEVVPAGAERVLVATPVEPKPSLEPAEGMVAEPHELSMAQD